MTNLFLCISCTILGGGGAWIVARFASKWGMIDVPSYRSSHAQPIPRGGGVGILSAFLLSSLLFNIPSSFWLPITALALLSFYGDMVELSPKFRLFLQFIAAIIFYLGINATFENKICGFLSGIAITVFIVGTVNFYNFMDGINGIATITSIVGFGFLAFYSFLSEGCNSFAMLSACICFSCLGFLPFNIPRANVFMGDVGSIFLGFAFAGMVVWLSKSLLDFICLSALLFPFYADELTTIFVRMKDGENLLHAHRRHLYQLLANEKGVSQWKVSVGYGIVQLVVGVTVLMLKPFGSIMILCILMTYFAGFTMVSFFIRKNLAAFL